MNADKLNEARLNAICFIATLITIGFLSKVGGTGADMAIMTGLIGVLGMLASRRERHPDQTVEQADTVNQNPPTT